MDPVTCLSVTCAVVQFVDFTFQILSGTHQIYEDGQLEVHVQTSRIIKDLSSFSKQMNPSMRSETASRNLTENEVELEILCKDCHKLADEMVVSLQKFEVTDKRNVWRTVGAVFKSIWSKKELQEMKESLSQYRDMLDSRLLGSLKSVVPHKSFILVLF